MRAASFPRISPPSALAVIIIVNAVLFVAVRIFGHWSSHLLQLLALPSSPSLLISRPWAPITYMFTQFAPFHLLANMILLYFYANLASRMATSLHGWKLWGLYIAGGLAGAFTAYVVCFIARYPFSGLLGASAAVLAVMAFTTLRLPRIKVPLIFFGLVELRILTLILILLIIIASGPAAVETQAAHAGGFLTGVAVALIRFRRFIHPRPASPPAISTPPVAPTPAHSAPQLSAPQLSDNEMLDLLLDKIRRSGYNSLSPDERQRLHQLSQRIAP